MKEAKHTLRCAACAVLLQDSNTLCGYPKSTNLVNNFLAWPQTKTGLADKSCRSSGSIPNEQCGWYEISTSKCSTRTSKCKWVVAVYARFQK
eukprot:1402453-Amphidinium_carterae.2